MSGPEQASRTTTPRVAKNSKKACEPCRRAKVRCNGEEPCQRCGSNPQSCIYRLKIRTRRKRALEAGHAIASDADRESRSPKATPKQVPFSPLIGRSSAVSERGVKTPGTEAATSTVDDHASQKVYHGITAMGTHPECNGQGDCAKENAHAQLFYGPSSNFAFLQQVHRGVLLSLKHGARDLQDPSLRDDGGLDMFMNRSIYFGTPSKIPPDTSGEAVEGSLDAILPLEQALVFLDHFKATSWRIFPFHTEAELRDLTHALYRTDVRMSPQTKALILVTLADGGLCTTHTDIAELLVLRAKIAAAPFDDVVTLEMIQYATILGDYQLHMGRPNSAYLQVGLACRKALAMGLHKESTNSAGRQDNVQKQRTTMWCLYFHDNWQSLAIGRHSAMKGVDITTPFPNNKDLLVGLCKAAHITEEAAELIYGRRYESLRQLYAAAQHVSTKLHAFAEEVGIGSAKTAASGKWTNDDGVALVQLQSFYYHSLVLTFRPFLIAENALRSQPQAVWQEEQMWLRQACRCAIDAAQDFIVYVSNKFRTDERCRSVRFNAFFLESSCAVLLFDMLSHPSKHAYNLEYIQLAIRAIDSMIPDEPIITASSSVKRILRAVETAIGVGTTAVPSLTSRASTPKHCTLGGRSLLNPSPGSEPVELVGAGAGITANDMSGGQTHPMYMPNIQFPSIPMGGARPQGYPHSLQTGSTSGMGEQMILFSDLLTGGGSIRNNGVGAPMRSNASVVNTSAKPHPGTDNWANMQFDVMTTDLFSFFPMDMTTPSDPTEAGGPRPAGGEGPASGVPSGSGGWAASM